MKLPIALPDQMEPELLRSVREDTAMRSPFSNEIYIRLTDNETGLACTRKYWRLFSKVTTFPLNGRPKFDTDSEMDPPRMIRRPRSLLGLTDES